MLQDYIDLLKHATEVMGNLGHSGAGFPEYVNAVGYEFLILGLGPYILHSSQGSLPFPSSLLKGLFAVAVFLPLNGRSIWK